MDCININDILNRNELFDEVKNKLNEIYKNKNIIIIYNVR